MVEPGLSMNDKRFAGEGRAKFHSMGALGERRERQVYEEQPKGRAFVG